MIPNKKSTTEHMRSIFIFIQFFNNEIKNCQRGFVEKKAKTFHIYLTLLSLQVGEELGAVGMSVKFRFTHTLVT